MEADIEIYRRKIADADIIVQGLKSTGENSIDNLVTKLSNNGMSFSLNIDKSFRLIDR